MSACHLPETKPILNPILAQGRQRPLACRNSKLWPGLKSTLLFSSWVDLLTDELYTDPAVARMVDVILHFCRYTVDRTISAIWTFYVMPNRPDG